MSERAKDILEWVYCIVIAVVIAMLIKYFVGTPTVVQQDSMYSTLMQGDRLILNRLSKTFNTMPKRGDIITFEAPSKVFYKEGEADTSNPIAKYEKDPNSIIGKFGYHVLEINKTSYIKRVIGIPGDHIEIKEGDVYRNGEKLNEEYLDEGMRTEATGQFSDITVPEKTIFAMGDNRSVSMDCRVFGCVPLERIEGNVVMRFWPLNKIGGVD
ncbi:MAG: signal peptidase I [Clostridia bacterium]|nr:signal peptidase I [Clostridia bacterium]